MMIHNSQGIIHKGTLVREWSIGPSLKQTLEVTTTRRCVRGRRSERGRAGAASSTLEGLPGTSMFHLLRGVCIGIFFSTLNTTGQPILIQLLWCSHNRRNRISSKE
ncbi:hypothetical protein ALC57_07995 [Trachymyrmex cornetzi]|uniref:Uncharacterized protein n=1 Tax=Trachymyrmex cornetzi TaxID=471704 RepID=A0A195E3S1_9HYME|nr:hypothetical protein ALC57_07995 [Trachymyrmex cornetzi]